MRQPEGIPHDPSAPASTPFPANGRPENPIGAARPQWSAAPTPAGFRRLYNWRDPVGWLLPLASALASFIAAALLFHSALISLALLALIFVHELGHVITLKLMRIPVSAPIFIPLVGAFVLPGQIQRARDMALVALAGPFTGGLGALACLLISRHLGDSCLSPVFSGMSINDPCFSYLLGQGYLWLLLAHLGFLFNLVNLLPLFPLDGGRVAAAISRWLWPLGILLSLALLLLDREPLVWILALLVIVLTIWAFGQREPLAPIQASTRAKISLAVAYAGLALMLAAGMLLTQGYLQYLQLLRFRWGGFYP